VDLNDQDLTAPGGFDWWTDLEISLVKAFGWSLEDIDETEIDSLIPFIMRFKETEGGDRPAEKRKVYVDQVNWL
jgi:hypothetical protein